MHVAQRACRALRLTQIWLLVSPGNPLKSSNGMAPLAQRLASARAIADGRRIIATDIEARLGTRFTFDTVRTLQQRFPRIRFVWLMGADNLVQLPRWKHWRELVAIVPFAVLPRPTYNPKALAGLATRRLHQARLPARQAPILPNDAAPRWLFLPSRQHHASATQIRLAGQHA